MLLLKGSGSVLAIVSNSDEVKKWEKKPKIFKEELYCHGDHLVQDAATER